MSYWLEPTEAHKDLLQLVQRLGVTGDDRKIRALLLRVVRLLLAAVHPDKKPILAAETQRAFGILVAVRDRLTKSRSQKLEEDLQEQLCTRFGGASVQRNELADQAQVIQTLQGRIRALQRDCDDLASERDRWRATAHGEI